MTRHQYYAPAPADVIASCESCRSALVKSDVQATLGAARIATCGVCKKTQTVFVGQPGVTV